MKIKILITSLLATMTMALYGQENGISGRIVTRVGRQPISDVKLTLNTPSPMVVVSDAGGNFVFSNIPQGAWRIKAEALDFIPAEINVKADGTMKDIGMVTMVRDIAATTLDEGSVIEFNTDQEDAESMPVTLSASRDVFDNVAAYSFGEMRFRPRGYDTGLADVYFNGIYMNDALTGYTPWSLWTGLNDAVRNQETSSGIETAVYGLGGINGTTNINAQASQLRKGYRFSLVGATNNYAFRAMATYASGMSDNGWAYAFSFSTRQGGNAWIKGVYTNGIGYYGSVEKKLNDRNRIALTVFGAPTKRGAQNASTQEVYDLVGSNYYNSNWGYQDGSMRNARVRDSHEPVAILNYTFDQTPDTKWTLAVSYRFGRNGYSAFDWYNAQDPRPDYYRYLPSYFDGDTEKQEYAREGWLSDWNIRQVNWDKLYDANYNSYYKDNYKTAYLPGVTDNMRRSVYIIEDRHIDQRDFNAKLQMVTLSGNHLKFAAGLEYRNNHTEYYKKVKDLLGGDTWLNINQFAERDFGSGIEVQNDLDNPNRLVKEGEKYGYDYYANVINTTIWGSASLNIGRWEAFMGLEGGSSVFWRTGVYRNGLFPDDSKGQSAKQYFETYTAKGGVTYKISGAHRVSANVAYMHRAPFFSEAFTSPRTRNDVVGNLTTEKIFSTDLTYSVNMPGLRARVTGYYASLGDQTKLISFYDDLHRSFGNFDIRGIDQEHIGVEAAAQVSLPLYLQLTGAVSYGYFAYTSNPLMTQTIDNTAKVVLEDEPVYWKKYKVSGTPQTAASLALQWRSPKYIFVSLEGNYYDAMYIDMNPVLRTDAAHMGKTRQESIDMAHQEMFPSAFVMNASVGASWYIDRKYNIGFSLNADNILNTTNIKSGGFEQLRLSQNKDASGNIVSYDKFDSKYFYMMGTTFYLNVYLRF